jgi:hypothetical protein
MSGAGHAKSIDYTNLLITPLSSEIGAGENWACGITLANGGTPWAGPADGSTGGPFNISAGMITNQNISSGGTTATLYGQAPNYPAVITITDTVNSITGTINVIPVITPRSGAINIYVGYGGIPDVPAPIVLASIGPGDIENYGDRIYQYQIIAHCNGGTSPGDVGIAEEDSGYTPFNNIGVDASVPTSDGSTTFFSPLAGAPIRNLIRCT